MCVKTNRSVTGRMAVTAVLLMGTLVAGPAAGQESNPINPGVNLFTTVPGIPGTSEGTLYDVADSSPIPADFFGPGSQPFDGVIYLQGSPLNTSAYGSTDTVVERHPGGPWEPPPLSDPAVYIAIEIVALNLVSCQPITVSYGTGPSEQWNVQVELPSSTGSIIPRKTHPNGGTFQSYLQVQPLLTFTRIGDGDTQVFNSPDFLNLTPSVSAWSYAAPGVLSVPLYEGGPGTTNFIPGADPSDGVIHPLRYNGNQFHLEMQVTPAPEPGAIALLGVGAVCLLAYAWRQRRLRMA